MHKRKITGRPHPSKSPGIKDAVNLRATFWTHSIRRPVYSQTHSSSSKDHGSTGVTIGVFTLFPLKKNPGVFLVVGEGAAREEIRGIFLKEGLDNRLFLAGSHTGRDLADAYNAMDVFVFSSRTETQGMVLTEAMAAGKAVIALDASGVREVVKDGHNGRLLREDASQAAFAGALEEYFNDQGKAEKWQKVAIETSRRFSRENSAKSLLGLYKQLLKRDSFRTESARDMLLWERLLNGIKVEWDLFAQKAGASAEAFNEEIESGTIEQLEE